ncbi:MAG: hypothetical protein PHG91_07595 [Syntrophales bacterium]|nr:hypothetical protein [Syntrophales bacterium]MDD5233243.1 hypothetical protein [Syntrophales bacterium]
MKQKLYIYSSLLVIAGLALISSGLERSPLIWQAGLALVSIAMLLSFLTHWAPEKNADRKT